MDVDADMKRSYQVSKYPSVTADTAMLKVADTAACVNGRIDGGMNLNAIVLYGMNMQISSLVNIQNSFIVHPPLSRFGSCRNIDIKLLSPLYI